MTQRIDGLGSLYLNIHAFKYGIITKRKRGQEFEEACRELHLGKGMVK